MKTKIKGYESFMYTEVFVVTVWNGHSVYKTVSVGFFKGRSAPIQDVIFRSVSTSLSKLPEFEANVLTLEEISIARDKILWERSGK